MKKLTKVEKVMLQMNDTDNYNSYRCPEDGIYQIRKDQPEEKQGCLYCKKKHPLLSKEEIQELLK